jgi:hypothetical protein
MEYDKGSNTQCITVETVLNVTAKAIEVMYEGSPYWLPKSQLFGFDGCAIMDTDVELEVAQWLLEEKGMI